VTVAVTLFALLELYKQGGDVAPVRHSARSRSSRCRYGREDLGMSRSWPGSSSAAVPVTRAGQRCRSQDATHCTAAAELREALDELGESLAPGARGVELKEDAGGSR
jgi:hypothetical protein